jgi:type IV pilus assembly protein PilC
MPVFAYKATSRDGVLSEGTMEAESREHLLAQLVTKNLFPVSVRESTGGQASGGTEVRAAPGELARLKVKSEEIMIFTRQLSTMIEGGLALDQAIGILAQQTRNESMKKVLYSVQNDIQGGKTLSEAFTKAPRVFPEVYTSMIRAAEASGQLGKILVQLAEYMESTQRIRQKVKSAMTYPVVATCLIVIVASVLILVVVPKFESIFEMLKGELPLPTKIVLGLSKFLRGNMLLSLVGLAGVVAGFITWAKTRNGRRTIDTVKLKMPIFGNLFLQFAMARFCRTFSTLISSGVPILQTLEILKKTAGNALIAEAVGEGIGSVRGGTSLARVFETKPIIPLMVTKMIDVGERTGSLETTLLRMSDFYDERVAAAVEGLTSIIEPLLIAMLGLVVGGIVVSIFFPIIKLSQCIMG